MCAQVRIMLSVLQFRLNKRYVEADPPFVSIELDQSDSGREGCAVSTLTITSEPADWQGAVQAAPPEPSLGSASPYQVMQGWKLVLQQASVLTLPRAPP